jgi:hypothetical protein
MTCRSCSAEIADKAIVCYRCGTPTAEPVRRDVPAPRRSFWPIAVVIAIAAASVGLWLFLRG